jgi:hypothetical protein
MRPQGQAGRSVGAVDESALGSVNTFLGIDYARVFADAGSQPVIDASGMRLSPFECPPRPKKPLRSIVNQSPSIEP